MRVLNIYPQLKVKRRVINFNYYRDEKLVNVKYRDSEKNFKLIKGEELIFYGLNNIKPYSTCHIVEGEMDLYQCMKKVFPLLYLFQMVQIRGIKN